MQVPLGLLITTPIVAGVTEEILYRGYAIERLAFLTGRRWLAGLIAGAAFLVAHAAWGGAQMILVAFGTVIFEGLYLWRRDLPCVILAHVLADLAGFAPARAQLTVNKTSRCPADYKARRSRQLFSLIFSFSDGQTDR